VSAASHGPVVDGALLTKFLRSRRSLRGEKQDDVAEALGWSLSKLARTENGTMKIVRTDLEAILRHYEVDQEDITRLTELASASRAPAWWEKHDVADKAFLTYLGYEAGASSIKMSQGLLVPGLLQTPDYARLISATYVPADDVQKVVDLRIERQQVVLARKPRQTYILDEAVVRRKVGDVMPRQIEHLLAMAEKPEISIRIVPFEAGPHFGMRGPFALLEFDVDLDGILFLESARRGDLLIPPADAGRSIEARGEFTLVEAISDYQEGFKSLLKLALGPADSRALIESLYRELLN
jgi:transcriptional regulator with XRE-family HTH domain